ncbi:hypothetical protein [Streptosporangium sp. NPDC002524]|uniref:hypothetical protein n=1 Tax=Streptosporangium sp. NPDC002524 TaxID=3154537 RepID=UPI00331BABFA
MNHPDVPRSQGRHAGGHTAPVAPGPGIAGAEGPPMLEQSSLEQVVARFGPMSPQQAAVVGVAVLDQLVAMHRQGMLHGDVRPGSVLLGPYEQIVLAAPSLPSSLFTSPEGVTSPAADLWSLGATLYTAVEGRPPSPGGSLDNAGPIAPVLFHLLAGDPAQRPDPGTLRGALIEVSQYRPEPPAAPPPGPLSSGPLSSGPLPSGPLPAGPLSSGPLPPGVFPSPSGSSLPQVPGTSDPGASASSGPFPFSGPLSPPAPGTPAAFGQAPLQGPGAPGTPGPHPATGPGTTGPVATGPGTTAPGTTGPGTTGPGAAGPQGWDTTAPPGSPGAPGAPGPLGAPGAPGGQEDGGIAPAAPGEVTAPFRKNLTEQMSAITARLPLQDVPVPPQVALSSSPGTPIVWQVPPSAPPTAPSPAPPTVPLTAQPSVPPQQDTLHQGPPHPGLPQQATPQGPPQGPPPGPSQQEASPQGPSRQATPQGGRPHSGAPGPTPPHQTPRDAPTSREPALLPVPAPGETPDARSAWTTGVLVPRPVVALTGVLLFGMAVTIGVLLTSVVANSDDGLSTAEPSGAKGRFATAPRACSLLDDKQVNEVVPGFKSSEVERSVCNWLNQHDWRKPNVEKYDLRVRLIAQKQDGSEVARAREYLAGKKKDLLDKSQFTTPKPLPPKDLRGVGEEAFTSSAYNSINLYGGSYKATVVFRISNLIAEVDYERGGVKEDPDGKISEGALKVARWLTESLKTDD